MMAFDSCGANFRVAFVLRLIWMSLVTAIVSE